MVINGEKCRDHKKVCYIDDKYIHKQLTIEQLRSWGTDPRTVENPSTAICATKIEKDLPKDRKLKQFVYNQDSNSKTFDSTYCDLWKQWKQ